MLVDVAGGAQVRCLPGGKPARALFPGVEIREVLDVAWWNDAPVLAAVLAGGGTEPRASSLALLVPGAAPRAVAEAVRAARFSPSGDALVIEIVARPVTPAGDAADGNESLVLELGSGRVSRLGSLVDPRWEASGQHLRATRRMGDARAHGSSVRARWHRRDQKTEVWGRGSAQLPAPAGTAVAWSEDAWTGDARSHCAVRLGTGGHQHPIVGPFCGGVADERGVRWSPDGRWLAFPRPGPVPGERRTGTHFIDVVGVEGGRDPKLSALFARVGPAAAAIAGPPGGLWLDWAPSGRFLAVQDGAGELRVYDLAAGGISRLGAGRAPTFSPEGGYLLVHADERAFVLPGASHAARVDLGAVTSARWLPAAACGEGPADP